jgi:hypothetical protein
MTTIGTAKMLDRSPEIQRRMEQDMLRMIAAMRSTPSVPAGLTLAGLNEQVLQKNPGTSFQVGGQVSPDVLQLLKMLGLKF